MCKNNRKLACSYYHELKFSQNKVVLLMQFENLTCPYYYKLVFSQKQGWFDDVTGKLNWPHYRWIKFGQKWGSFLYVTLISDLLLSSWTGIFAKIRKIYWSDLEIWTAPIIADQISEKWGSFDDITW